MFYLILYRLTVLLGKRLQQPPAYRPDKHIASPRRGAADFPCLRQLPPPPKKRRTDEDDDTERRYERSKGNEKKN